MTEHRQVEVLDEHAVPAAPPASSGWGLRAAISAMVATTVVTFPSLLLGGLAVFLRHDLGFSDTQLGALVSIYFVVCAFASVPVGRLVERLGSPITTSAGIGLGAVALIGMGLAPSYLFLLVALMVGGIGNALGQLGSNQSLAREVTPRRQGLAFGVKQAAVPAGTLLASAAVPTLGQTVGWRWAFVLAAAVSLAGVALVPRKNDGARRGKRRTGEVPVVPLVVVAVSATLASSAANALGIFLVEWGVNTGLPPERAALVLASGSAIGVIARIAGGWMADRRDGGHLTVVSIQLACGAVGLVLIAFGSPLTLTVGAVIGYGFGWSWPGLLNYAIVQIRPSAAASATSIIQVGMYAGNALGPLCFGFLADTLSFPAAWRIGAVSMCVAAALLGVGRWMLRTRATEAAPAVRDDVVTVD